LSHEVALTPHPPLHILHELLLRSNDRAWANDAEPADRLFGYETKRERETESDRERDRAGEVNGERVSGKLPVNRWCFII
jgi:hypothetical protein